MILKKLEKIENYLKKREKWKNYKKKKQKKNLNFLVLVMYVKINFHQKIFINFMVIYVQNAENVIIHIEH